MKIFGRKSVGCLPCSGTGTLYMTAFVMGKGKQTVARDCHSCRGHGTLRRR